MPDNRDVIRHFLSLLPARIAGRSERVKINYNFCVYKNKY